MRRNPLLALALAATAGACTMERPSPDDNPELRYESAEVAAPDMQDVTQAADEPGAPSEPAYQSPVPTPPVPVPDERAGLTATGRFIPVNQYPINASVTVSNAGTVGTLVSVAIYDAGPSPAFKASVNRGPCGNTGPEVAPLDMRFQVGASEVGAAADTVPIPATTLMNGQHVVVLKPGNAGPATPPIACAPIPANQAQVRP